MDAEVARETSPRAPSAWSGLSLRVTKEPIRSRLRARGHHLINRAGGVAVYLEVGARHPADVTTCSDIDMMSTNADGRFTKKDGTPYP